MNQSTGSPRNVTIHLRGDDGHAMCGSPATKALTDDPSEVTCGRAIHDGREHTGCLAIVLADEAEGGYFSYIGHWIVVVTFRDGDELDTEVFGPFDGPDQGKEDASLWSERFLEWWDREADENSRTVERVLVTKLQPWGFVPRPERREP